MAGLPSRFVLLHLRTDADSSAVGVLIVGHVAATQVVRTNSRLMRTGAPTSM